MAVHATLVRSPPESIPHGTGGLEQAVPVVINPTGTSSGADLAAALEGSFGPGPYTAGGQPVESLAPPLSSLPNGVLLAAPGNFRRAPVVAPPPLVLVTHSGPDAGRIIELRRGRYRLGRPGLAALPGSVPLELRDPALSRLHAELVVSARGVRITDAGSQNGVWVDGRRVGMAELSTDSLVGAGNTTFRICVPSAVRLPEAVSPSPGPLPVPVQPPGPANPGMLLAAALALGLGVVLAITTGMWIFLAFSALTALTSFAGFASLRRRRRQFRAAEAETAAADKTRRRLAQPTPGTRALAVLQTSLRAVQQHRFTVPISAGAEELRLGTGTLPANIGLKVPREGWEPPLLDDVPVPLTLAAGTEILVMGPALETTGMLRSLLLQLAASGWEGAGPVIVLCKGINRFISDARLLPGVQVLSVADDSAAVTAIQQTAGRIAGRALTVLAPPSVSAEAGLLRAMLPDGVRNSVVFVIGTSGTGLGVPPRDGAAGAVSITLSEDGGVLRTDGRKLPFRPDLIGPAAFHRTATLLARAGTPHTGQTAPRSPFPTSSTGIAASWSRSTSPQAALGYRGAASVSLDLLSDGPHFLVAGTTGSGKSELLRTFIVSLAAAVPPDQLNFLLIDFKGGSGLTPLARLPHTAGILTDLSGENVARTLTSLRSELKRREALLAAAEASDLDAFNGVGPPAERVPRLVVVIDEFRMLADTVPTAVEELMRIAALGRSLGLHLVLATQRPQGAVTADIRANISTTICLRVQSALESRDVVGCDDAAQIPASSPGMAILRKAGAPAVPFKVSSTLSGSGGPPPLVQSLAQYLATPLHRRGATPGKSLEDLVGAVRDAASAAGYPAEPPPPVQPPLPDTLSHRPGGWPGSTPSGGLLLGLADRPEQQRQDPLEWSPARDSHLALVGPASSGADTSAVLVAAEHLAGLPGRHLYVLDGDGSLAWTAAHTQTGAYVPPHETRRAARVAGVLSATVLGRLARGANGPRPGGPAGITLLVSGWGRWQDGFRSSRFASAEDDLLGLARDGAAADVCLVISGNRELLAARFFQLIPNRLWFPAGLPDDALVVWPRMPPMEPVPGRAYVQGRIGAPAGAVAQCLEGTGPASLSPLPAGAAPPQRVEALPSFAGPEDLAAASGPDRFPLGLHGDALDTAEAQLAPGTAFLILGPPGSGRTTLLRQFARAAGPQLEVHRFHPPGEEGPGDSGTAESVRGFGDLRNYLILVDNADRLPLEVHPRLAQLLDRGARLVLAAAPGFGLASRLPLAARLRSDPRGALLAPEQQADTEFFAIRLTLDTSPHPGRGYLISGSKVTETQFACPA